MFSPENWLQLLILLLSLVFVFIAPYNTEFGIHIGAWAVFLAWLDITTLLGRIELFGEYIFMAIDVTKTLLKTLIVFTPSFVAFSLTFNMLLKGISYRLLLV